MENWSDNEFQQIFATLKRKHEWLEQKYFVYVSCLEDFFATKNITHYANKMEWQWHECNYKKVERNPKDKRFATAFKFICPNRRPFSAFFFFDSEPICLITEEMEC